MDNYLVSNLKLSDGARTILAQLHITTTDELAGVVIKRVAEQCGENKNIFKEIEIIIRQLRNQRLIPAEYTPEQLRKMSHRSIDELWLQVITNHFLKDNHLLYIDQVALLTAEEYVSLEGIGRKRIDEIQKAIRIWLLNFMPAEKFQKAFFTPGIVRDGKLVPKYMCQIPITASLLNVMGRHAVKELQTSGNTYRFIEKNEIETIGDLAVQEIEVAFDKYKYYAKHGVQELQDALFAWIETNVLSLNLLSDDVEDDVRYLHAMEDCARILEAICKVSRGKLYTLLQKGNAIEMLDLNGNEESAYHNYKLALSVDGLKKPICSIWKTILSDNVDYITSAEEKLQAMPIPFKRDFVEISLQKQYILKRENQYVLNCEHFMNAYSEMYRFETISSDIMKMYMHGKSLKEIAKNFFSTEEEMKRIVKKEIKRIAHPFEEAFREPFRYFALEKDVFLSTFPEMDEQGYTYLCTRYRRGRHKLNPDNLASYTGHWKERLMLLYENKFQFMDEEK